MEPEVKGTSGGAKKAEPKVEKKASGGKGTGGKKPEYYEGIISKLAVVGTLGVLALLIASENNTGR